MIKITYFQFQNPNFHYSYLSFYPSNVQDVTNTN